MAMAAPEATEVMAVSAGEMEGMVATVVMAATALKFKKGVTHSMVHFSYRFGPEFRGSTRETCLGGFLRTGTCTIPPTKCVHTPRVQLRPAETGFRPER